MDVTQLPLSPTTTAALGSGPLKPTKTAAAAEQFEALLIGEMLKSVRESGEEGWMGGGGDSSAESAFGMAETQLAQSIAARGGLGLAKFIRQSLDKAGKAETPSDGQKAPPAASSTAN